MTARTSELLGYGIWNYLQTHLAVVQSDGSVLPSDRAVGYLRTYITGVNPVAEGRWPAIGRRFDQLEIPDCSPNVITATDLVAVSFLSVNVPGRAAWNILTDRQTALTEVLTKIPLDMAIEDPECSRDMYRNDSALQNLWNLLRRDEAGELWNMGPTTISKVMARKRPALVPIQDGVVMRALDSTDADYWEQWWQAMHLHIDGHPVVTDFARILRSSVPTAAPLSLLRTLDIVLWMNGVHEGNLPAS